MIKLLPTQIAKHWDLIRAGVLLSLPPIVKPDQEVMKSILTRLLCGDLQCWAVYENENLRGHVLTYIAKDNQTGSKTLNIYSLYLKHSIQEATWEAGIDSLLKFGKANGCFRLAAYTKVADVLSITKRFGFNSDYRYIMKEIL